MLRISVSALVSVPSEAIKKTPWSVASGSILRWTAPDLGGTRRQGLVPGVGAKILENLQGGLLFDGQAFCNLPDARTGIHVQPHVVTRTVEAVGLILNGNAGLKQRRVDAVAVLQELGDDGLVLLDHRQDIGFGNSGSAVDHLVDDVIDNARLLILYHGHVIFGIVGKMIKYERIFDAHDDM
mgnify:CR=1 FL=1